MDRSKIYLIEWHDAYSEGSWLSNDGLKKFIKEGRCICISIGWIIHEDEHEIIIASRKVKWHETGANEWGML